MERYRAHVLVCAGAGCISSGCFEVEKALKQSLVRHKLTEEIKVVETGCVGTCDLGPLMVIYPEGVFYQKVKPEDAEEIVAEHLLEGRVVKRLLFRDLKSGQEVEKIADVPFYSKQLRIALRNCGQIDPGSVEEYVAKDGYKALGKVLGQMAPQEVRAQIKASGIRGRGGAGFPTGSKWQFTAQAAGDKKYVVCNADEGDPGAFMDRSILEGDPHSVIEAMAIAGYAVGAQKGFVYVRAEYPLAVQRLGNAIEQARQRGFLGRKILDSAFSFDIEIRVGAGAFVCGEETALIASIEGKRGEPRPKPPFPASNGLWDCPTLINNVETYANIPAIILKGPEWFQQFGTEKSKGTKVFAIAGKVNNTGLAEVPMGTTLRELVYDVGGGIPGGKKFKAAQTGGPSGGCIPAQFIDTPLDYESLRKLGAIMGSGGLIIMDEDTCMVDVARFFLEFTQEESCGKCTPCRVGTRRMLEILTRITRGEGEDGDIEKLEALGKLIISTALCGLGQSAPNPVLSTIRYFRDEYEAHIYEKRCPAGVCQSLLRFEIDPALCQGCGLCVRVCSSKAISGQRREAHAIDQELCVKCGNCLSKCPFGAIRKY
mgnify:FL=1